MKTVTIQRACGKHVNEQTIRQQIELLVKRSLSGGRGRCWTQATTKSPTQQNKQGQWVYTYTLKYRKVKGKKQTEEKDWEKIFQYLVRTAKSAKFNKYPWLPVKPTDYPKNYDPSKDEPVRIKKSVKDYGIITLEKGDHFKRIFDREAHIDIIYSALETAVMTDLQKRFHCVLFGPPGCGKTDILLSVGRMLGAEGQAYLKFDATSTTQAMALDMLLEAEYIPPVLIVEEIEKTDEKSLRWLLGLLDDRGEVRKTNCRVGHRSRDVKMLCLATANDMELFKKVMAGALASRFSNKIYCPRPTREVMRRILEREIGETKGGNLEWVEPTLAFGMDVMGWDDPRQLKPICLCGKDRLLDGSYQRDIIRTMEPDEAKGERVEEYLESLKRAH